MRPFPTLIRAHFLSRPNRFRVQCMLEDGRKVNAFMPNPGRMWELLTPNALLFLNPVSEEERATRKTAYTVVGVERHGEAIFLHTHVTNQVAQYLLEQQRIPGLKRAHIVRPEVTVGKSRFDFLLEDDKGKIYCEVKSCTLFGNGVAMFPDAITERGRKHLLELAQLHNAGHRAVVIFIVHSNRVNAFMPDYHTDPAFSSTLHDVRDKVSILPVSIHWTKTLALGKQNHLLPIPWDWVQRENVEQGTCVTIYHLSRKRKVPMLGNRVLEPGYYLVNEDVSSNMEQYLNRLKRKPKHAHTVADWFRKEAQLVESLPIRTADTLGPALRQELNKRYSPLEGVSDGAVYLHGVNPLTEDDFHMLIESFRMRHPK